MSDGPMIGRLRVSTFVISERRDTVYAGSMRDENPLNERTAITLPIISLDFRVTRRFGLQASGTIPVIARTGIAGAVPFRDAVHGFGDTVVGAWYRGGSPSRWNWTVNGGLSLPTGATRAPRFRSELDNGSLVPLSRLQRGSGTVDPTFGVSAERPLHGGRWVSSVVARAPVAENADGLRVGTSAEVSTGWAHYVRSHRVMAFGRLDRLHREQDVFHGIPVLVGGGSWTYLTPGIAVLVGKGINLQANVKVPVYRRLANRQLDSHAIFQVGASRSF
jgi:hypothetical protein